MKDTVEQFSRRLMNECKEFQVETIAGTEKYLRRAQQVSPNQESMDLYANKFFDLFVGFIPLVLSQIAEITPEVEEKVIDGIKRKFEVVRASIEAQRLAQSQKRPAILRP